MAATYVVDTDLASYLKLSAADAAVTFYAGLANDLIVDVIGDSVSTIPTRVKTIGLEAAARGWRTGDGLSSVTTSFDDSSRTERREGGSEGPGVYLTDSERAELVRLAVGSTKPLRAGTIFSSPATPTW